MKPWQRAGARLTSIAAMAAPLVILSLIHRLGVNIPFEDDWDMIIVLQNWHDGRLAFADFWQQHSEHRVAITRGVVWLLGIATDADMVADMFAGLACVVLTLMLLRRLLKSALEVHYPELVSPLTLVSALLLCSLVFEEIWFFATTSIELFVLNLATVGMICALRTPAGTWRLGAALGCALVGMLASAQGAALWATGSIAIGLTRASDGRAIRRLAVWIAGMTASVIAYGWGLQWGGSSMLAAAAHPGRVLRFMLACLGLPFAFGSSPEVSALAGLAACIGLGVAAWRILESRPEVATPLQPFALLAFHGLLVSALIASGRWQLPARSAMASHYALGPSLFWIATIVLAAVAARTCRRDASSVWKAARITGLTAVVYLLVVAFARANREGFDQAYIRSQNLRAAMDAMTADEALTQDVVHFLYPPDGDRIREQIRWLRDHRLGPFAPRKPSPLILAASERVGNAVSESIDGSHDGGDCDRTFGWAWDPSQPDVPLTVDVWQGNTRLGSVRARWFRPDLAAAGKGNGRHAFVFYLPSTIEAGTGQRITVTVAGTQRTLPGSPRIVSCQTQ